MNGSCSRLIRRLAFRRATRTVAAMRCWIIMCLMAILALAGCATNKINWVGRVGTYTHDQAILELGPPDKQAVLTDGAVVAEWLTKRGSSIVYSGGAGYYGYPGYYGGVYPSYVQTGPDYFLRLTFDADGKLRTWKKFMR